MSELNKTINQRAAENLADVCVAATAVTPDTAFDRFSRGLWVGVGGDVEVTMPNGDVVVFKNAADGSIIPVATKLVVAANTTATDIVAMH